MSAPPKKKDRFAGVKRCYLFPKTLGDSLSFASGAALKRRGFSRKDMLTHWQEIAGAEIARYCSPLKLSKAGQRNRLHLKLLSPAHLLEVQYAEPLILERLNRFYGYAVAQEIVIVR